MLWKEIYKNKTCVATKKNVYKQVQSSTPLVDGLEMIKLSEKRIWCKIILHYYPIITIFFVISFHLISFL
jgi:hypothetical protein